MKTKNILISGGTGLVGTELTKLLLDKNFNIGVLSRSNKNDDKIKYFQWDYTKKQIDAEAIEFADVIVHLAGENISTKKWTSKQKKVIIDSRVETTKLIADSLKQQNKKLDAFISASAIGYYGTFTSDIVLSEESDAGVDFLADVVVKWEKSVDEIKKYTDRVVLNRIGVVLSNKGGALPKIYNVVKKGIGAPLGSGKQQMPWISINDLARLFLHAIENENIKGVYNAVTDNITNAEFTKKLAKSIEKPYFMPKVPAFVMKTVFGEMSTILLEGSKVSSDKIKKTGFIFENNLDVVFNKLK